MYITEIHLGSFGKYQDRLFSFEQGVNIIYGNNEKGKSTLHKFIEAMLFGLNTYQFGAPDYKDQYSHYLPWNNHEAFFGSLDFVDKGKTFHVEQDFLKEHGVKVFLDGTRIGPYKKTEDNSIIKHHEHKMLRVLGISDISARTGSGLVNEMQDKILNIKATNSGSISVDQALKRMEESLEKLENSNDLLVLRDQMTYYRDEMNSAEVRQKSNLEIILKYYETLDETRLVQREIDTINSQLSDYETYEKLERYKQLMKLNNEIAVSKEEAKALAIVSRLPVEAVEKFVKSQQDQEQLLAQQESTQLEIDSTSKKIELIQEEYGLEGLEYVQKPVNKELMTKEIDVLDGLKARIENHHKEYKDIASRMDLFQIEEGISPEQLKAKEVKLDEDYQRFLNTSSWRNRIMEDKDSGNSTIDIESEILSLSDRYLNLRILSLFMQIIAAVMTLGMFARPRYAFALFFGIMLCLIIILISLIFRRGLERKQIEQEFMLKKIQEDVRKNKQRLHSATSQLSEIMETYHANSEAEYVAIYEERKSALRKMNDLVKEDLLNKTKTQDVSKEFQDRLAVFITHKSFIPSELVNNYEGLKSFLMQLKEVNETYRSLKDKKSQLESELMHIVEELGQVSDIEAEFVSKDTDITSMNEYQNKRERWVKLNEKLQRLAADKESLIGDESEELIMSYGKTLLDSDNNQLEDALYDVDVIKNMKNNKVNYKEELQIKSSRLKAESEHLTDLAIPLSKLSEKYNQLASDLYHKEYEINVYKEAITFVESASSKVYDKFKDQLKARLQTIMHQVIGEQYQVFFDADMRLMVKDLYSGEEVNVESLSQGTMDQIYFALRIGLISSIEDNINIPLILDDSFVHYDGGRLEQMLGQVARLDRQVIILTCHPREEEILRSLDIPFNYIEL